MIYKRTEAKNGRIMFFVGEKMVGDKLVKGKMTAEKDIPASILSQLEGNMHIEIGAAETPVSKKPEEPVIKPEDRVCFIDQQPGKYKKFLELQTVYLCDEHQHSLTTGEVVYEMRKAGLLPS